MIARIMTPSGESRQAASRAAFRAAAASITTPASTGSSAGSGFPAMVWQLWWEHTPMLAGDVRGNCIEGITEISRRVAGQVAAGLAARHWPADRGRGGCRGGRAP
jgi:hypothetical protein